MTEQQLNTLKVVAVIAGVAVVVVVALPLLKSLSDTGSNIGKVASDVTGIAADITGAAKAGADNVTQYLTGNSATKIAGYKAGAWAEMVANPHSNPFSPAYALNRTGEPESANNEAAAKAINDELASLIYVSPAAIIAAFTGVVSRDDCYYVVTFVNINQGGGFSLGDYLSINMATDSLDAIAGNIIIKPLAP